MSLLPLNDESWGELDHAYGKASNIPELIKQFEKTKVDDAFWDNIWSHLCHQDTVYPATFAAIPHFIQIAYKAPDKITQNLLLFLAVCEISRQLDGVPVEYLGVSKDIYLRSLEIVPELAIIFLSTKREYMDNVAATAAINAVTGQPMIASLLLTVAPEHTENLINYYYQNAAQFEDKT